MHSARASALPSRGSRTSSMTRSSSSGTSARAGSAYLGADVADAFPPGAAVPGRAPRHGGGPRG
eukprot:5232913-Alexandrium_andersonii.AAC.1